MSGPARRLLGWVVTASGNLVLANASFRPGLKAGRREAQGPGTRTGHATDRRHAAFAAVTKARIFAGSLTPGRSSTPDEVSTAGARVIRMAAATLPACSPPASVHGTERARPSSRCTIGRASVRESVCQFVVTLVVADTLTKK